jgi:hypothetical protein
MAEKLFSSSVASRMWLKILGGCCLTYEFTKPAPALSIILCSSGNNAVQNFD